MYFIAAQLTTTTTVASTSTAPSPPSTGPSAMDAGDVFAGLSALIALAALIVAISALRRQTAIGKEQNAIARDQTAIQARLAAIEEGRRTDELDARQRAHVVAKFIGTHRFVLANQGAALAREVRCSFEPLDNRGLPAIFGLEDQPFDIQPGHSLEFDVAVALADSRVMRATVSCLDDAGPHAWFQDLRL